MWFMEITLADETRHEIRSLGGAGYLTKREALRSWGAIPSSSPSELVLDLIDPKGDIVDDKYISRDTAETLLGRAVE
jgi:hypothetical protein